MKMTTKYTIKKCSSFGFAQTFNDASNLYDNLNEDNFIYLHDNSEESLKSNIPCKNYSSIDDIQIPPNKKATIFVELGYRKKKLIDVPVEYDDSDIVNNFEHEYANEKFKSYILDLTEEDDSRSSQLSNEFVAFLLDLYPHLRD